MTKRDDLAAIAMENMEIFQSGAYVAVNGARHDIQVEIERSITNTVEIASEIAAMPPKPERGGTISVAAEDTLAGIGRLQEEGCGNIAVLNFASATNPGGGFLRGGKAQEEDLCRATTLYAALAGQPGFYARNKAWPDALYADALLYSPHVIVFRDAYGNLLPEWSAIAVISAPAPNFRALTENDRPRHIERGVKAALITRISMILGAAQHYHHDGIVLGAWGCGVFGNSAEQVGGIFSELLQTRFESGFRRVHFAIPEGARESNFSAFRNILEAGG